MISAESDNFDIGSIPTFDDLKEFINKNQCRAKVSWVSMKDKSAGNVLIKALYKTRESNQNNLSSQDVQSLQKKSLDNSIFVTREGSSVGGGTKTVLNALAVYLRDDW